MRLVATSTIASLFFLSISLFCFSQNSDSSYSFVSDAKASAISSYDELMQDQLALFNGIEYVNYDKGITGNPYFLDDYYANGFLEYDGMKYHDIPLKYDVVENLVLVQHFNHAGYQRGLVLQIEKVRSFEYEGHRFVKINTQNPVGSLKEGFYDLLLDDEIGIYVHRKKTISRAIKEGEMNIKFINGDQYFVYQAETTYRVSNKSSVLKLYSDRKKELKQYIKINGLDLKHNFEESLILVTREYIKLKAAE